MVASVVGRENSTFLNRTESNPLVFRYLRGEIVRGLEIAIADMKQGEQVDASTRRIPRVT